jgi:hypothetical protein
MRRGRSERISLGNFVIEGHTISIFLLADPEKLTADSEQRSFACGILAIFHPTTTNEAPDMLYEFIGVVCTHYVLCNSHT